MFIRSALVVLAGFLATSAEARSLHPDTFKKTSQLIEFDLPKNMHELLPSVLTIDSVKKTATLILNPRPFCPPGHFCAAVMPQPIVYTLPIVDSKQDNCRVTRYVARKDQRPVDGSLEQLLIIDRTNSICESMADVSHLKVEVRHITVTSGMNGRVVRRDARYFGLGFGSAVPTQSWPTPGRGPIARPLPLGR